MLLSLKQQQAQKLMILAISADTNDGRVSSRRDESEEREREKEKERERENQRFDNILLGGGVSRDVQEESSHLLNSSPGILSAATHTRPTSGFTLDTLRPSHTGIRCQSSCSGVRPQVRGPSGPGFEA